MRVSELVSVLETVAPTLGSSTMLPITQHFWFTGQDVLTYDDHLAMQTPCSIGMELTLPGQLLPLLKASNQSGELKLKDSGSDVLVSVGRHKATLPAKDIRDANKLFEMPAFSANTKLTADMEKFKLAVEACKLAFDDSVPYRNGITLLNEEDGLCLYAYSNDSLCRCVLSGRTPERIMLPAKFWTILLSLAKPGAKVAVGLREDMALAQVDKVTLFAKTVEVPNPVDLRKLYDGNYNAKHLQPISIDFQEAVQRAAVLAKDDEAAETKLTVEAGVLNVHCDSLHGVVDDRVEFDHPNAHVTLKPKLLLEALERFKSEDARMSFSKRVVAICEPGRVFLLHGKG